MPSHLLFFDHVLMCYGLKTVYVSLYKYALCYFCRKRIPFMKSLFLKVSLFFVFVSVSVVSAMASDVVSDYVPKVMTLMTYNIRNATADDGQTDFNEVVSVIRKYDADFVALQELDSVTNRSKGRHVLNELALLSQYFPVFGSAIDYDGGKYGLGILAKRRPLSVRKVPLPGREEARIMLIAEFHDIILACTHLSLTEEDRMRSLEIISAEAQQSSKPFFLAGDFNDKPDSKFIDILQKDFTVLSSTERPTFPAGSPKVCIDYIASFNDSAERIVFRKTETLPPTRVSDHVPLLVQFQLKTPVERILYSEPYLQNPSSNGITVMFQTQTLSHAWVEYGTDTLNLKKAWMEYGGQAICHDIEHKVRLKSLSPGEKYYYRVCAREILHYAAYEKIFGDTLRTRFHPFSLPEERGTDFTAIILNDLHQNKVTIAAMSKLASEIQPDFVVFNGDCLTEPSSKQDAIRMIHQLTSAFNTVEIPAFFIRGNHEIRHFYSAGLPSLLDQPGGQTYGAFSWGDTRFVILDCGEDKPDDHWVYYGLNDFSGFRKSQLDFLERETDSRIFRRAKRKILLHHIPLWGNGDKYQPCLEFWHPVLNSVPFDVAISGHTHKFRYHPNGSISNPFPVCIGGGPRTSDATMMVLQKKGKELRLRVLNAEGRELGSWSL